MQQIKNILNASLPGTEQQRKNERKKTALETQA